MQACSDMPLFDLGFDSFNPLGIDMDGSALLSECDAQPLVATEMDRIFLPGLCFPSDSFWMPSSPPETGPTLSGSPLPNPTLCGDSLDRLAPWAGAKQAIPIGL
ncbi:hypothetical protein V8C37DRAFT_72650 [Trichoderma ceciliae]